VKFPVATPKSESWTFDCSGTLLKHLMANDSERVLKLNDLFQISGWQQKLRWQPFCEGVDIYRLYEGGSDGPSASL